MRHIYLARTIRGREPIKGDEFLESPSEYSFVQDCVELITNRGEKCGYSFY